MTDVIQPWNKASFRHVLVDMHIPDWDPEFLKQYQPEQIVDSVTNAGGGAAMVYFQSHVGLCYWPTKSGQQHAAFLGRDPVAEIVDLYHARDVPVCAYYSVNFNNWAYLEHPDWRLVPAAKSAFGGGVLPAARYGQCCLNNPGYRDFVRTQSAEIVEGYDIDAMFFDMMWWQSICICNHCKARYQDEANADIPAVIDWHSPDWCKFQAARERWLSEFAMELRDGVHKLRPNAVVYHNFALALSNWTKGVSFNSAAAHDFLGGDFYGGRDEQLVISRLMLNLSESKPVEFMTTIAANLAEHEGLKRMDELEIQALAATACASSFLMIAPINPDGTPHPEIFQRIKDVYNSTKMYEPYLGGEAVEDIAIYYSSESKMNFAENGRSLNDAPSTNPTHYPHFEAVRGACKKLQSAHLPFGIITRKQLSSLSQYKVLILPNVLRMDEEEVTAVRNYVRNGGKVYASRLTSLTETHGILHKDFMLSDIFGCNFSQVEDGRLVYIRPCSAALEATIAPQSYVSHWQSAEEIMGAVRLRPDATGKVLAKLSLPYGYPHGGAVEDHHWASIHSSPPWEDTDIPAIVETHHGDGSVIYSAADIETAASEQGGAVFVDIIKSLLGDAPSFEADTHPAIWMTAFDQEGSKRMIVSFLNFQEELPVIPVSKVPFILRAPNGRHFKKLLALPDEKEMPFNITSDGSLVASVHDLAMFQLLAAEYE